MSWNGKKMGIPQHSDHDDDDRQGVEKYEAEIDDLVDQAATEPLAVLDRVANALPELDLGYHKLLLQWLKPPYAVAIEARKNPALVEAIHAKLPKRVKRYDPKDILRHTMQIAGRAFDTRKTSYSLACQRERALRGFFEQGVAARDLPRLIEEAGGIGILDDDLRAQSEAAEGSEVRGNITSDALDGDGRGGSTGTGLTPDDCTAPHDRGTEANDVLRDDSEADPSGRGSQPDTKANEAPMRARRTFNRKTDLAVTLLEEVLGKALSQPTGTPFAIYGVVGEPAGAWKKLRADRVLFGPDASPMSTDNPVDEPRLSSP